MADSIFVINEKNEVSQLTVSAYESEALLQQLIADHPQVLGGAPTASSELLLIKREQSVPDSMDGAGRWSLDHLFVDQNAVPVLVEVKRASDTRARREVVAQMLDYAANGVAYWPIEQIIAAYEATCSAAGQDHGSKLTEFLAGKDPELFWRSVESNLRSGRIRMVFLADVISKELRRIVEFLNEQMRPAEVLAVEVKQYLGKGGLRTLVPILIGATERAQSSKSILDRPDQIDEQQWLASLADFKGQESRAGAEKLLGWLRTNSLETEVSSSQDSIFTRVVLPAGKVAYPFFMRRSTANFEVSLPNLKNASFYASDESRLELLSRIKRTFPEFRITSSKATGWPSIPLLSALQSDVWERLSALLLDITEHLRGS